MFKFVPFEYPLHDINNVKGTNWIEHLCDYTFSKFTNLMSMKEQGPGI